MRPEHKPKCMSSKTDHPFGERCLEPAKFMGPGQQPLCAPHAERLREAMRDPYTFLNMRSGRVRSEREIELMVRSIQ